MTPIYNTSWENSKMHIWYKFGDSSSNQLQVLSCRQANFQEFYTKMAKMNLKVKVNVLHFQYEPRVSHDACLAQI